jgi:hypothetical protein
VSTFYLSIIPDWLMGRTSRGPYAQISWQARDIDCWTSRVALISPDNPVKTANNRAMKNSLLNEPF